MLSADRSIIVVVLRHMKLNVDIQWRGKVNKPDALLEQGFASPSRVVLFVQNSLVSYRTSVFNFMPDKANTHKL